MDGLRHRQTNTMAASLSDEWVDVSHNSDIDEGEANAGGDSGGDDAVSAHTQKQIPQR